MSSRYPHKLLNTIEHERFKDGYVDLYFKQLAIRVVVLSRMPEQRKNAFWQLFSAKQSNIIYGTKHYTWQIKNVSTVMNQLYEKYQLEGFQMSYTIDDYLNSKEHKKALEKIASMLTTEQRLAGMETEQRMQGLKAAERMQGLKAAERMQGLKAAERIQGLKAEERYTLLTELLKTLSPEQIQTYLAKLEADKPKTH